MIDGRSYPGKHKLICGWGINDADYQVQPIVDGVQVKCPFYKRWQSMILRCYSAQTQRRQPTYIGCSVVEEWRSFMNFRAWMIYQDWEGKHLDKDLRILGNKIYGPDTCLFVTRQVNNFFYSPQSNKGLPCGVSWHSRDKIYIASCVNLDGKKVYLGQYNCPDEAEKIYLKYKHNLLLLLAEMQTDVVVRDAILSRMPEDMSN